MKSSFDQSVEKAYGRAMNTDAVRDFMTKVYGWMVGGLLLTGGTAYFTAASGLWQYFVGGPLMWLVIIAQFGLVLALSAGVMKMSSAVATAAFLGYSALTGLTFSALLIVFAEETIYQTFFITAGMFASLSFWGYVTKKNLTGLGSFMIMGLVGIIITMVVNVFFRSSALQFLINFIGVVVFAGLTAYDTQRIKELYEVQYEGTEMTRKVAIIGALSLYLDFINLFLFLLRFAGGSNRD